MIQNVIPFVHDFLIKTVNKDEYTIDATCGNGNDTLFLSAISKHVYAFDIQQLAINNTNTILKESNIDNVTLIHDSHDTFEHYIDKDIKAITYNLGYLPGSDKSISTSSSSTIRSIENGLKILSQYGVITIVCYVGHKGGQQEADKIEEYINLLSNREFKVIKYQFLNVKMPPYVLIIEKQ